MANDLRQIEDYLPIEAIGADVPREKSVRKMRISTLNLCLAQRPLLVHLAALYGALLPAHRWMTRRPELRSATDV
ncbi:MAG: DUF1156 domain-containing protein [Thermoguttaceae bacterium]